MTAEGDLSTKTENTGSGAYRYIELDSLRGLAAVTVVFHHTLFIFDNPAGPFAAQQHLLKWIRHSPFYIFCAGHEAVLLFFVLSGFVLSLPFLSAGTTPAYIPFLIRRLIRIYVPYLFAILVSLWLAHLVPRQPIQDLGTWFEAPWKLPISTSLIVAHVAFLGDFANDRLDPVIWSLTHEMRISIIFPALVMALLCMSAKANCLLAAMLMISGTVATLMLFKLSGGSSNALSTITYVGPFILGFLLSRNASSLMARYKSCSSHSRVAAVVIAAGLYIYSGLLPGRLHYLSDMLSTIGAAMIVSLALVSPWFSFLLRSQPLVFLGRISYSLYLYHSLVILALVHAFYGTIPILAFPILIVGLSVLVSYALYLAVEAPAHYVGRYVAKRWSSAQSRAIMGLSVYIRQTPLDDNARAGNWPERY